MPTTSALVIGGSLAGMCAARVLSDCVDRVTILERDAYPSAPDFRPGVPQARHVHNLLARGLHEFEGFFPGFERRLRERGAVAVESGWDVATLWPHGWSQRTHTGLWQLYASRALIGSVAVRLFTWYRPKLVAGPDRQVGARLGEVTHLVRPMASLFAPRVVARVLVAAMGRRLKAMGRRAASDGLRPMPPGAE
jgi:hypothetical protein